MELRLNLSESNEKDKLIIDLINRKTYSGGANGVKQLLHMIAIGQYVLNNNENNQYNMIPNFQMIPHVNANIVPVAHETFKENEEAKKFEEARKLEEEKEKDLEDFSSFMDFDF